MKSENGLHTVIEINFKYGSRKKKMKKHWKHWNETRIYNEKKTIKALWGLDVKRPESDRKTGVQVVPYVKRKKYEKNSLFSMFFDNFDFCVKTLIKSVVYYGTWCKLIVTANTFALKICIICTPNKWNRRCTVLTNRWVLSGAMTVISWVSTTSSSIEGTTPTVFCDVAKLSAPANLTLNMFGTLVISESRRDSLRPIFFDCFRNRSASTCCAALSTEHESSMAAAVEAPVPVRTGLKYRMNNRNNNRKKN